MHMIHDESSTDSDCAVFFEFVPAMDRVEMISELLSDCDDAEAFALLHDWFDIGVWCEYKVSGVTPDDIRGGYPPAAHARLTSLVEEALLARLPAWQ